MTPRGALRRTFSSLHSRNYRLYFFGQLISLSGTWVQQVAQNWLVLELTDRSFPVGLNTSLQFLPVLLFGVWGGLIADRFDNRRVLLVTQSMFGLQAIVLCVLVLTGAVELWMVYLLGMVYGLVTAVDMPARQAFVIEMVGPAQVPNAVALNSALFNIGQVVGPALAGVSIATVGLGPTFLINTLSFPAVLTGLALMDPTKLHRQPRATATKGQVREGLLYVWSTPMVRAIVVMVTIIGVLGLNHRVVLPLLARFTFEAGASGYGLMTAVMAAGSVVGALVAASRSRPSRGLLLGAAVGLAVFWAATAAAPTMTVALVVLFPVGFAVIAFLASANATIQLTVAPELRGRVMAVYGTVLLGSGPIGALIAGGLAEGTSPRAPLWLSGAGCAAAALFGVIALRRLSARRAAGSPPATAAAPPEGAPVSPHAPERLPQRTWSRVRGWRAVRDWRMGFTRRR